MSSYLRHQSSKLWFIAFVLLPATIFLGFCNALDARDLRRAYDLQVDSKRALRPGDIVVISGRVEATPAILPERFPVFRDALVVVKQHEKWRWGRGKGWGETRRIVWRAESRSIGGWQLDDSVIDRARFEQFRASPCSDYAPPAGWVSNCPFSDYVKSVDDSDRRFSYLVTPIPDGPVTLIAVASYVPRTVTAITQSRHLDSASFAIVRQGVWTGRDLLTRRLHNVLVWMGGGVAALFLVAWLYSHKIHRRLMYLGRDRTMAGDLLRAAFVAGPYAVAFWPFAADGGMLALAIAAAISYAAVLFTWWEGRAAPRRGFGLGAYD